MKPILYVGLAASLALGACASTYKTAQTPDDVYYSPRQQQRTYASSDGSNGNSRQDENASYVQAADEEGSYVTYQDEDQGDYQRRLNRFGDNANSYSGGYWDGYNAASNLYFNSFYGGGLGWAYSPFNSWYGNSFSLGFGWGSGFYRPWGSFGLGLGYGWGYPYVGSYWPGYYSYYPAYYNPYYGGGWIHGGGYYSSYRSPSYGPVRSGNERIITRSPSGYTRGNTGGNVGGNGYVRPARGSFQPSGSNGGYTPSAAERPRRIFQQSPSERPVVTRPANNYNGSNNSNNTYSRPQRVEYSRPVQQSAPVSRPSYSPSPSPSGGGGGGYSRPVRGGR
ncbi:hypothetical protein SAMN05660909_00840 [Chitinophaga terrae (ex Kim and Jung 2007)]|uniref:Prolyl-tRNA synthetase n=1 Tax=Chitinophaga terrae (ex Kim and Jung 2007) TaxID=408074 RepID=A0A1H3YLC6_9BACT|nr:hypothetical protein [Chitinophaga terrae (ex Kim and Jung 2007)]MDQ0110255.1 hypothetical protein [Chitinophaga terrae (ex Kim and Jung 2007)]GEP88383.1 hypothetical protein CTE07_00280 [Chitinophaga terrae (ex Kim and Jung 2007)]SEA12303.1 hypothetical protein SAMN05660909_00840 [Chitinophaga terrae (ex Kim and Jung 2007)]